MIIIGFDDLWILKINFKVSLIVEFVQKQEIRKGRRRKFKRADEAA